MGNTDLLGDVDRLGNADLLGDVDPLGSVDPSELWGIAIIEDNEGGSDAALPLQPTRERQQRTTATPTFWACCGATCTRERLLDSVVLLRELPLEYPRVSTSS